jgi:hypothetical protein
VFCGGEEDGWEGGEGKEQNRKVLEARWYLSHNVGGEIEIEIELIKHR